MEAALKDAKADRVVLDLGKKVSNSVVHRQDIDQFMLNDPAAFNLYLLALRKLQGQSDVLGYFQIAGIHGLPARDWDGVRGPQLSFTAGGYCTHGLMTFPTWHRPYVAQMEQALINTAIDIAKVDFPNSTVYKQAAQRIRAPYWDPYRPRGGQVSFPGVGGTTSFPYDFKLPRILTEENVAVLENERSTELRRIPNPLCKFNFPELDGLSSDEWDWLKSATQQQFFEQWTCRNPDNNDFSNSDTDAMNADLNQEREGLVGNMVNLLTISSYKDYRMFSNHSTRTGLASGSLEGFHDQYHSILGGLVGHMGYPPVAAFDPVFWLHHCNIDRLFAIWQTINHRVWWPTILQRGEPSSTTPLTPFRHTAGDSDWWTSDLSKQCSDFGYTYPDLDITDSNALLQDIARRYNWSRQGFFPPRRGPTVPQDMQPPNIAGAFPFEGDGSAIPAQLSPRLTTTGAVHGLVTDATSKAAHTMKQNVAAVSLNNLAPAKDDSGLDNNSKKPEGQKPIGEEKPKVPEGATVIRQWYVDSETKRMALNGTFTIYFFIGPFDDNPATYKAQPSFAGQAHFFIAPPQMCDNCMQQGQAGAIVANTTTITPMLHDYMNKGQGDLRLASLEPNDVKPFLIKNLRWKVLKVPGPNDEGLPLTPVPTDRIEGFKIHVNSDVSYLEEGSYLPVPVAEEDYDEVAEEIMRNERGQA